MIERTNEAPVLQPKDALRARITRLKIDEVLDGRLSTVLPYLEGALIYGDVGDFESAYRALEDAIELDPVHLSEPYIGIIEQALALDRMTAATGYFAQGLDLLEDPGPLQARFGNTLATEATLRAPMASEAPYILAAPQWGSQSASMVSLLDAYVRTFRDTDIVRLVVPAEMKDAQIAVEQMQDALRQLAVSGQGMPNIAVQVIAETRALRPLVYRARAVYEGEDMDGTAVWLAQRLQRPLFSLTTPETLRRIFS